MISSQLVSNGNEFDIKGPVQLIVPLPYHTYLQSSDTIPAWTFDMTTGNSCQHSSHGTGNITNVFTEGNI